MSLHGANLKSGVESEEAGEVERFALKRLVKSLGRAAGIGTSLISLVVSPGTQLSQVNKMLADEVGSASCIKSRANRQSVLSAITSTQQRLKRYTSIPPNGLVLFCGLCCMDGAKERKVTIDLEPFRPVLRSYYLCDNRFHTDALAELLQDDDTFGFVIIDGNGCLIGTLSGNERKTLCKIAVDLPNKHRRGGQSALRFSRLRQEKRMNFTRKCAELVAQHFLGGGNRPSVRGLIFAGSAEFKSVLAASELLDPRLRSIVLSTVDVSYGGENGFSQAIALSSALLANVKLERERKLILSFFEHIAQDTGRYCFGVEDTFRALEQGAVESLIVWEDLPLDRVEVKYARTGESAVHHVPPGWQAPDRDLARNEAATEEEHTEPPELLEVVDRVGLVDWLAAGNYKQFGAELALVSDRSQEGSQFSKGFGGVGGILRWKADFADHANGAEDAAEDADAASSGSESATTDEVDWDALF